MDTDGRKPSAARSLFRCFFGTVWIAVAIHWTAEKQFHFGRRGSSTLVTSEDDPIFYWGWLVFCFSVGILVFISGVTGFRALIRSRKLCRVRGTRDD
jgi:hypothetical protein